MKQKIFDIRSAYGQLILLVFVPICFLAGVGAWLVYDESVQANKHEQQTLAQALLLRYQPVIQSELPHILSTTNSTTNLSSLSNPSNSSNLEMEETPQNQQTTEQAPPNKHHYIKRDPNIELHSLLLSVQAEKELLRVAIINQQGEVIRSSGVSSVEPWFHQLENNSKPLDSDFVSSIPTGIGTAYGLLLGEFEWQGNRQKLWLFVDMDNQPVRLAQYRIGLALVMTGLLTILLLLLSLNIYSRRWIEPIYKIRLYLQGVNVDNLQQPLQVKSDGELRELQEDVLVTFDRLDASFRELKRHSEQTEDDLRQAFDEMEMQNISIRNARDQAVSTSQAKSAFLANISHELRTPLNSIDGFINLLARHGNLSSEQDLYVQTIRKSSAHLLALVNDVLDFSKIEAGKLVLDSHEFELYTAIYDVVDMLSPLASEKGLRMGVLVYNDVPLSIIGDSLRVKQVLTNLVANAIKFTDAGDILVRVSLDEQDNHLNIAVQDTGRGVSEQDQKHLFKSFSQGDPSITRQYGGTGLGLVISKQLTRLMGGDIGYYDNGQENIASSGSTFWFTVPTHVDVLEVENTGDIALPILATEKSHTLIKSNALTTATHDGKLQILVWINHAASVQVLQASLQPLAVKLTQTNSLAGTLEKLKEQGNLWDWVIVDSDANIRGSETEDDMTALMKQIRLHYQGRLAVYGYQVALDTQLLHRYKAFALHEPLDKRQLYNMLDKDRKPGGKIKKVNESLRWQGRRVLAVDDHQPNLLVLEALLAEQGIEVVMASSGFDAIEIISKTHQNSTDNNHRIDLIFMDIQMPRMSGHQAAEQIRKIEQGNTPIPIIALTAHGMSDERDKLMKSGINDYVGKPISQLQLSQILQKWLGRKHTPEQKSAYESKQATINQDAGQQGLGKAPSSSTTTINQAHSFSDGLSTPQTPIDAESLGVVAGHTEASDKQDSNLAVIDWEDALIRAANKPDLAAKLIIMMIDSVTDDKQALEQAWQQQNYEQLLQVAHRILGASRYTGVPEIRHTSQILEDHCHQQIAKMTQTTAKHETQTNDKPSEQQKQQQLALKLSYQALLVALDNLANADLTPWAQLRYHRLEEDEMAWKMI